MNDTQRADARVAAYLDCVLLVREAVRCQRSQMAAHNKSDAWHKAHPEHDHPEALDLTTWYTRANAVVDVLDGTEA